MKKKRKSSNIFCQKDLVLAGAYLSQSNPWDCCKSFLAYLESLSDFFFYLASLPLFSHLLSLILSLSLCISLSLCLTLFSLSFLLCQFLYLAFCVKIENVAIKASAFERKNSILTEKVETKKKSIVFSDFDIIGTID